MSNLAQLQKRLAAAFGPAAASHVSSTHEDAAISSAFARYDEVHAAEADPVTPAVAEGDGDPAERSRGLSNTVRPSMASKKRPSISDTSIRWRQPRADAEPAAPGIASH